MKKFKLSEINRESIHALYVKIRAEADKAWRGDETALRAILVWLVGGNIINFVFWMMLIPELTSFLPRGIIGDTLQKITLVLYLLTGVFYLCWSAIACFRCLPNMKGPLFAFPAGTFIVLFTFLEGYFLFGLAMAVIHILPLSTDDMYRQKYEAEQSVHDPITQPGTAPEQEAGTPPDPDAAVPVPVENAPGEPAK